MELLKDTYYPPVYYKNLAGQLKKVYPALDENAFYKQATAGLKKLELKERIVRAAEVCRAYLPSDYKKATQVLYEYAETLETESFSCIFMPEFVARYGQNDYVFSMRALKYFTQFSSSELAIRVFLQNDFTRTLKIMREWSEDDNYHVRRLASEGTRPRLPWATRVPALFDNPNHAAPILRRLKADTEKYVQKSVANHLNDISKDHPEWVLNLVGKWGQKNKNTAWIIKHAVRGLIKKGDATALSLFGVDNNAKISLTNFRIARKQLTLGEYLPFSFNLQSAKKEKLVIDYKIYFVKKSGECKPKVFKIKETELTPGNKLEINKKHLFKDFTTRKHYAGMHALEIIINGKKVARKQFSLMI